MTLERVAVLLDPHPQKHPLPLMEMVPLSRGLPEVVMTGTDPVKITESQLIVTVKVPVPAVKVAPEPVEVMVAVKVAGGQHPLL